MMNNERGKDSVDVNSHLLMYVLKNKKKFVKENNNFNMMKIMMLRKMFNKKEQNTDGMMAMMNAILSSDMGYDDMMNSSFNSFNPYIAVLNQLKEAHRKSTLKAQAEKKAALKTQAEDLKTQAEEKLAELMEHYQTMLNQSNDCIPESNGKLETYIPQNDPSDGEIIDGEIINSHFDDK